MCIYFLQRMIQMMNRLLLSVAVACWLAQSISSSNIGGDRQDIDLADDGGYYNLLIAIDNRVEENTAILTNLQVRFLFCFLLYI